MPSTLLTGANSFFAAHLINQLISDGHNVTGTVRSLSKGEELLSVHPEWKDNLHFVEVSQLSKAGTWDTVFQQGNFDYVIHNAAPVPSSAIDFDRDYLEPGIAGNVELLQSAQRYGPNIRNITFVGSINSVTDGSADSIADRVFTNKDWLPLTPEDARRIQHPFVFYGVAKKEAEKAIWDYVEGKKPHYSVTVFLPSLIVGPAIHYVGDLKSTASTTGIIYSYFNGTNEYIPRTVFPSFVDARDAALAHVRALTIPAAANKRFLLGASHFSSTLLVDTLKSVPELAHRLPAGRSADEDDTRVIKMDVSETDEVFGIEYRGAEETFGDTARRLLELERELA